MTSSQSDREMRNYYEARAPVYDRVYQYPERQEDLRLLEARVSASFSGCNVLEVAAGTGYWTQFIAQSAARVLATDATQAALDQVAARPPGAAAVTTCVADAYELGALGHRFNAAFAGLWFSHVPRARWGEWLANLHDTLEDGALVVLMDNSQAQCERFPITFTDDDGNTFQDRSRDVAQSYRVLKNFPTEAELLRLAVNGTDHRFEALAQYWWFEYRYSAQ